ncbi:putative inactive tRNA-specific adenosine deaminase-like protein 3 [Sarcoptes scabiei]|nr:putative inactive tRNA-specific adenosine deaminase-like protein 3 [Sarcoptes scabiei]
MNKSETRSANVSPLLISKIEKFLISYQDDLKKPKRIRPSHSSPFSSMMLAESLSSGVPDPTTANAFNTSRVVLRRSANKPKSAYDGVPLSNYRLKFTDIRAEVFDWINHFLWLKKCPIELATIIANHISLKMAEEIAKDLNPSQIQQTKNQQPDDASSTSEDGQAKSQTDSTLGEVPSSLNPFSNEADTVDCAISLESLNRPYQSDLPSALHSHDVAQKSRNMVDNYLTDLGSDPQKAVQMVNDYLDSPSRESQPFTSSIHAMQNLRSSMEDRHVVIHNLNKALDLDLPNQYSYYAIFDGHAGIDAASFSTAHLHLYLVESESFRSGNIEEAFRQAFLKTDALYTKRCKEDGVHQLKPSGTTALCLLIENNKTVYLAWAGDSQAVLVRNGVHEEIMLPHKPDLQSEKNRIQKQGGFVIYSDTWRVNGVLSVTRAIGDPDHKSVIISDPSFSTFEIDPSLDFLVLGCDGLFDHLTGQDITSYVFEYLCRNETNDPEKVIEGVSKFLSEQAIKEGSSDNITSIVIFFKPFEQLISTGFPSAPIASSEAAPNIAEHVSESPNTTTLPTTNGGHFPYTDFAELPIGTNYKLAPEGNSEEISIKPTEINQSLPEVSQSMDEKTEQDQISNSLKLDTEIAIDSERISDLDENLEQLESNQSEKIDERICEPKSMDLDRQDSDDENKVGDVNDVDINLDDGSDDNQDEDLEEEKCEDEFDFVQTNNNTIIDLGCKDKTVEDLASSADDLIETKLNLALENGETNNHNDDANQIFSLNKFLESNCNNSGDQSCDEKADDLISVDPDQTAQISPTISNINSKTSVDDNNKVETNPFVDFDQCLQPHRNQQELFTMNHSNIDLNLEFEQQPSNEIDRLLSEQSNINRLENNEISVGEDFIRSVNSFEPNQLIEKHSDENLQNVEKNNNEDLLSNDAASNKIDSLQSSLMTDSDQILNKDKFSEQNSKMFTDRIIDSIETSKNNDDTSMKVNLPMNTDDRHESIEQGSDSNFIDHFESSNLLKEISVLEQSSREIDPISLTESNGENFNENLSTEGLTKNLICESFIEDDSKIMENDSKMTENDSKMTENDSKIMENDSKITENDSKITENDSKIMENNPKMMENDPSSFSPIHSNNLDIKTDSFIEHNTNQIVKDAMNETVASFTSIANDFQPAEMSNNVGNKTREDIENHDHIPNKTDILLDLMSTSNTAISKDDTIPDPLLAITQTNGYEKIDPHEGSVSVEKTVEKDEVNEIPERFTNDSPVQPNLINSVEKQEDMDKQFDEKQILKEKSFETDEKPKIQKKTEIKASTTAIKKATNVGSKISASIASKATNASKISSATNPGIKSVSSVPKTSKATTKPSSNTNSSSSRLLNRSIESSPKNQQKIESTFKKPLVTSKISSKLNTQTTKAPSSSIGSRVTSAKSTIAAAKVSTASGNTKPLPTKSLASKSIDGKPAVTSTEAKKNIPPKTIATRTTTNSSTSNVLKKPTTTAKISTVTSKVGSFRTNVAVSAPKSTSGSVEKKATQVKPLTSSANRSIKKPSSSDLKNSNTTNAIKKTVPPRSTTAVGKSNGVTPKSKNDGENPVEIIKSVKPVSSMTSNSSSTSITPTSLTSSIHKRNNFNGTETSLKQELEDAVMNAMNNASAASFSHTESMNNE